MAEQAFDLDAPTPRRAPRKAQLDAEYDIPDDLVAAARRAAQAAAAKAEERGSGSRIRRLPGDGETTIGLRDPDAPQAVVPHHLRCRAARHQRGASL